MFAGETHRCKNVSMHHVILQQLQLPRRLIAPATQHDIASVKNAVRPGWTHMDVTNACSSKFRTISAAQVQPFLPQLAPPLPPLAPASV